MDKMYKFNTTKSELNFFDLFVMMIVIYESMKRTKILLKKRCSTEGVLLKKVFLKILQNSQENTSARVYF